MSAELLEVFLRFGREASPMTPERVREIRERLGLSQTGLSATLRLGPHGKRSVARWEKTGATIPGPVQLALEALDDGWRPGTAKWAELRQEYLKLLDNIAQAVTDAKKRVRVVGQEKDSAD